MKLFLPLSKSKDEGEKDDAFFVFSLVHASLSLSLLLPLSLARRRDFYSIYSLALSLFALPLSRKTKL